MTTASPFLKSAKSRIKKAAHTYSVFTRLPRIERAEDGVQYTAGTGSLFICDRELRTARARVKKGAAFLDRKLPGWENVILPQYLKLDSCQLCVCGQLAYALSARHRPRNHEWGYFQMVEKFGLSRRQAELHGFNKDQLVDYPALEVEWHRLISRRLKKVTA